MRMIKRIGEDGDNDKKVMVRMMMQMMVILKYNSIRCHD